MKICFNIQQLRRRILQPTAELMAEVAGEGNVTLCGQDQRYAFKDNGAPVLAVAHCDYVDCGSDHFFTHKGKVWSSRLDDRLGVYVILDVLPTLGISTDILVTDDEEKGRSTAQYFDPTRHHEREYNWMVQFDRRGTGAVCYEYANIESYVVKHFKVEIGSFSDISSLEHLGVCGVNIGTAYYDEHTLGSYAVLAKLRDQLRRFIDFHAAFCDERIPHVCRDYRWGVVGDSVDQLEWLDCGAGMWYAGGYGRDEYEIMYMHGETYGFPWRLSMGLDEEWFATLQDAKDRAQEMYDGVI